MDTNNSNHVSFNAAGPRFTDIVHNHARIHTRDRQENQE